MEKKCYQLGVVSWEVFNDLYENQYDLIRKIRFFIQAGKVEQNEELALEMLGDLLALKQDELEEIRRKGIAERTTLPAAGGLGHFQLVPAPDSNGANNLMVPIETLPARRGSVWSRVWQFIWAGEPKP